MNNLILKLLFFVLLICDDRILATDYVVKNSLVKNNNGSGESANIESRTFNENYSERNLDVDTLKGLIKKVTHLTPSRVNKSKTSSSHINISENLQLMLDMVQKLENRECIQDLQFVLNGLMLNERWALQMFDAFPKFPVGLMYGNLYQLGNFDECTSVSYLTKENSNIQGQYCLADIAYKLKANNSGFSDPFENDDFKQHRRFKFNSSLIHWGTCLPSSCKPKDVSILVQEIFTALIGNFESLEVNINDKNCYFQETFQTSTGEIIYGSVIGAFLLFIIFSTILHIFYMKKKKKCITYNIEAIRRQNRSSTINEVLLCFSLIQTIKKLLKTKPTELNLECICGIKFLSMGFIIFSHTLIFIFGGPMANANFPAELTTEVQNGVFWNSPLLVDTFLLISGFLMCRLLLLELEKRNGKVNFITIYIARYIRLTPAYLVIIGLYLTWLPKLGSGPLWKEVAVTENQRCLSSWWTNLLYVNNYVRTDSLCMFQAWYLAVDYHLFIIAPFLIYPLWKWKKLGTVLLGLSTICVAIIPAYFTFKDSLDPTFLAFPPEIQDLSSNFYFVNAYIKTHMRAGSYFLGLVFGYTVHRIQSKGTKVPKAAIWIGWIMATLFGISSMFSIVVFYEPTYSPDYIESAVYAPLHRIAWCFAIGWVIIMCVTDNAATVNKFLTWKFFVPFSRLTYSAYLINGLVVIYHKGTLREAAFLSKFQLAYTLIGHMVLTFFFAFLLCICFESPIHGLEKILLRMNDPPKKHSVTSNNTLRIVEENRNA